MTVRGDDGLLVFGHAEANTKFDADLFHYTACGLDNVYLTSGYHREEFDGDSYTSVRDVEGLHVAIAVALAVGRRRLKGNEIAFLRKYLGLTQSELADEFGVDRVSVNRYENDKQPLPETTRKWLQLLVLQCFWREIKDNAEDRQVIIDSYAATIWEIVDWLRDLEVDAGQDMPPAFVAAAAIGNWKMTTKRHG